VLELEPRRERLRSVASVETSVRERDDAGTGELTKEYGWLVVRIFGGCPKSSDGASERLMRLKMGCLSRLLRGPGGGQACQKGGPEIF
jgi:hypothetical protein